MSINFRGSEDGTRRHRRDEPFPRGPVRREGNHGVQANRRSSRSRSPLMTRNQPLRGDRNFYQYDREREPERDRQHLRRSRSRDMERPLFKQRIVPGPPNQRLLRMDEAYRHRSRSQNRHIGRDRGQERRLLPTRHDGNDRRHPPAAKQNSSSNSVFADLDRAVKKAREEKGSSYWNKKVIEAEERDPNRWGHSGFKELYTRSNHNSRNDMVHQTPPRKRVLSRRSRSPGRLLPRRSRSPGDRREPISLLKSLGGIKRVSPVRGSNQLNSHPSGRSKSDGNGSGKSKEMWSEKTRKDMPRSRPSEIGTFFRKHSPGKAPGHSQSHHLAAVGRRSPRPPLSLRPNSGRDLTKGKGDQRQRERIRNSSVSEEESSRTPSPQLKNRNSKIDNNKEHLKSTSSSESSSDDDVLEIHARDRQRSLSASSDESVSGESVKNTKDPDGNSSTTSDSESSEGGDNSRRGRGTTEGGKRMLVSSQKKKKKTTNGKAIEKGDGSSNPVSKELQSQTTKKPGTAKTNDKTSDSESDSSSDSEEEPRMTLSERFAKLTQMSTDKREFAKPEISIKEIDTKLKVVKDLRNANTKIITSQIQKPVAARARPKSPEILGGEGEMRYSSDDRRRHFERMTRDEPLDRERPQEWDDVRVRYNYYKTRGYFDERPLTLDEYVKWEAWWYDYRDWLAGEGYYDQPQQQQHYEGSDSDRVSNWRPSPHPSDGPSQSQGFQRPFQPAVPDRPPLIGRPLRFGGARYHNEQPHHAPVEPPYRVPISRRIGHSTGGSLIVNVRHQGQGNYRGGGRGRLAGRIGFRR